MFADKNRVELLVDQIFFEEPTFSLHDYMTSALLDLRRAMARETQLVEDEALGRPPRLAEWLQTGIVLPPWESELLFELFAEYPLSVIQGGSGCGKTSALVYAASYCARVVSKLKNDGKIPLINKLLFAVDLQDQDEYLKTTFRDKAAQDQQTAQFLASFCSTLDTDLQTSVADDIIGDLFDRTFLRQAESPNIFTTRVLDVRFRVGAYHRKQNPGQMADWDTALRALNSEDMPHGRVVARYLLLQELARQQFDRCSTRLVLVVDNVDPFPDYLQTALIRTFQAVTHGYRAQGGAFVSPFSICLLARHSTVTRRSGALDGVEAHRVPFRAADPADLIFFRLSSFLVAPNRLKTWGELSGPDRERLSDRLWLLWQRLTNPQEQFSRVLSGLAGTNARTGCKLARWWVLSPRLLIVKGNSPTDNSSVTRAVGAALLLRVAHATARAIRSGGPCLNEPEVIEDIPQRVFGNLLGILLGNRIVRMAEGMPLLAHDVRTEFSGYALGVIRGLFRLDEHNRMGAAASSPVIEATHEVVRAVTKEAKDIPALRKRLAEALTAMEKERRAKLDMLHPEDQEIAKAACLWLCNAVTRGITGSIGETHADESVAEAVLNKKPLPDRTKPNRWESTSILISPDSQYQRTERSALNVFSADGIGPSPVALHVLCGLQEAKHGLDAVVIKERLGLWGFGDHEIRLALRGMVEVDHRLVYSKVKDFSDGMQDWFDAYHPVHISSAGSQYLKSVIPAPAYLQWALIEPSRLREALGGDKVPQRLGTGLGRVAIALEGLRFFRADEIRRLKLMGENRPHDLQKSLSPVLWAFFSSLARFIIDISGLQSFNRQEAQRIANDFIVFANDQYTEFQDTFGMVPDEWGLQLGSATLDYRIRFRE